MIINLKNQSDKYYTELARAIGVLECKGQLTPGEASCLLDVLDLVAVQRDYEFHRVLDGFLKADYGPEMHEIDEIVKATLTGVTLKSAEERNQVMAVIEDLTREKNRIGKQMQGGKDEYLAGRESHPGIPGSLEDQ